MFDYILINFQLLFNFLSLITTILIHTYLFFYLSK